VLAPFLPLLVAVAVGHNAVAFALGAISGRLLGAPRDVRRALVFELGIQNSGLALVILLGQLRGLGGAAAVAALWGVWHIVAGGLIVVAMRTHDRLLAKA
jgi:bile acid:Na+ symporter, BASS family